MAKEPPSLHVGVIATSLGSDSRSQELAAEAMRRLKVRSISGTLIDLRQHALPLAGSDESWGNPSVAKVRELVAATTHLIFAVPIYNFDVNSAAKTFIELMGEDLLGGKTVAFLCAAGGQGSYMSILSFANSLMLDFRCWIVPRFVYVTTDFVDEKGIVTPEIDRRLDGLIADLVNGPVRRKVGAR